MRKYLYWIGLLAFITLAGSYWYLNHFLDEIALMHQTIGPLHRRRGCSFKGSIRHSLSQGSCRACCMADRDHESAADGGEISFATVARDIMPAVVNVSTNNAVAGARQNFNPANQVPAADGTMKFQIPFREWPGKVLGLG
ncbi:hypothetical protein CCP3SC1_450038 [Gammaproteobacteria bacterium]